ncbi:alpha/beta fold hydrolase [Streptomyces sp. NPDC004050]
MPRPGPAGARHHRTVALVAAVVSSAVLCCPGGTAATQDAPPPTAGVPRLDWSPCTPGSPYDCATARVPLDHADPGGRAVDLALVRRKATDGARRIGTLFVNPGGPGGPGTVQVPQNYDSFPEELRERFDIVSWDPRGIGNSTAVNCFDSTDAAETWGRSKPAGFPVGQKERTTWIEAYEDLGRRCEKRDADLLRHVSTADTARDLDLLRQAVGEPQLNYFGVSYGTILGATYANMFPDRVRAMVLDSNIAPSAWTNGGRTPGRPRSCAWAPTAPPRPPWTGSSTCADPPARTAAPSRPAARRFDRLLQRLRERPVGTWTYARTVADAVSGLYVVDPGWADLARRLQDLWQGRAPKPAAIPPPPPVAHPAPYLGDEQAAAVWCGDSPNLRDPAAYHRLEEGSAARVGDAGRYWTWAAEPCATWPARAADRYDGPWNQPTAHPVMVVGTRYDPSTPYTGSEAMAKTLADARLLTHDGYGHTALFNNASSCVKAYESRYVVDGTLPPPGTTCRPDEQPFSRNRRTG